jgi:hypothetical protein
MLKGHGVADCGPEPQREGEAMHEGQAPQRRDEREERAGREGGLLDRLRRVVAGQRPATVLIMEPDGRMRQAQGRAGRQPE